MARHGSGRVPVLRCRSGCRDAALRRPLRARSSSRPARSSSTGASSRWSGGSASVSSGWSGGPAESHVRAVAAEVAAAEQAHGRGRRGADPDRPRAARHRGPRGQHDGGAGGGRGAGRRRRPRLRTPGPRHHPDDRHRRARRDATGRRHAPRRRRARRPWRPQPGLAAVPALVGDAQVGRARGQPRRRRRGARPARRRRPRGVPDRAGGAHQRPSARRRRRRCGWPWSTASPTSGSRSWTTGSATPATATAAATGWSGCASGRRSTAAPSRPGTVNGRGFAVRAVLPAGTTS